MAKKKKKKINPVILVLICACLLFAMYTSLSTIALGLFGQTVMGVVDSYDSRLDSISAGANRSRTVSMGYSFMANGKEYRGYVMYMTDEAWPHLNEGETRSERISYFSFCPYINKPSALTDFDQMGSMGLLYHIFAPFGCMFLLLLVTGRLKRKKKTKKTAKKSAVPQNNYTRSDMDMFCYNCGNKLPEGVAFCSDCGNKIQQSAPDICSACGAAIPDDAVFCINCGTARNSSAAQQTPSSAYYVQQPQQSTTPFTAQLQQPTELYAQQTQAATPQQHLNTQHTGLVGFSERCSSPEILAAAQKNKKFAVGCLFVLVFTPLIGFPIAGLLMDDFPFGESLVIGTGIALVMLIINLLALRRTKRPVWEGTVVNKYSKKRSEHKRTDGESDTYTTYTEYTTVITTDAGKKKTIVEKDSGRHMYDYLSAGDRVRFHPMFGTYEKYDKSKDRVIYCNVCSMMNPIQNDRCKRCNNLLFK